MENITITKKKKEKSIHIRLVYKVDNTIKVKPILLPRILLYSNRKYPKYELFGQESTRRYIKNLSYEYFNNLKDAYLIFYLEIPHPDLLEEDNIPKAIEMLLDTIYDPDIENNEFTKFDKIYTQIDNSITNNSKRILNVAYNKLINEIDEIGYLKDDIYVNPQLLNQTNAKDLYEYYQKNIVNNSPYIFIYGNVKNDIKKYFKKYLNNNFEFSTRNTCYYPTRSTKKLEITSNYNQSVLVMNYRIKDMSLEDEALLIFFKDFLISNPHKLIYQYLRGKEALVYTCDVNTLSKYGLFNIIALINNQTKEKTITMINEMFKTLKNEAYLNKLIDDTIKVKNIYLKKERESRYAHFDSITYSKLGLGIFFSEKDYYDKLSTISGKDILDLINRLELNYEFFLKGDKNDN